MKDLSETTVSIAVWLCGIAVCYWILGEWLIALVEQSLDSIKP